MWRKENKSHLYLHYQQKFSTKIIDQSAHPIYHPSFHPANPSVGLCMRQRIISKEIVADTSRSGAHVFKDPKVVNWKDTDGTISRDGNTVKMVERLNNPVWIGAGPSVSPNRMGSQEIGIPVRSTVFRNSGTPNHWTLPFMEFILNIGTLHQLSVR